MSKTIVHSLFSDLDIHLFKEGKHHHLHKKLGAHLLELNGVKGTYFAVFAPAAKKVSVIGNFNYWQEKEHELFVRWDKSGIWEGFIPNVKKEHLYKYKIYSTINNQVLEKADPFAFYCEMPPKTASIVWQDDYKWQDNEWMKKRTQHNSLNAPFSVYEVHLASWKKRWEENNRLLSYRELAKELVEYVQYLGFTHVELMPIMEHPYNPSWGYQITGYFAPTSRFGTPQDFKYLIDCFHQANIGVILDWVPAHFPADAHGLGNFDGSHVYEHPDIRKGYHPDWKSLIFNYERAEVQAFLISNALFWLENYHIDGLRVDAVASMIYLDYSRKEEEWQANKYGGNHYLAAIDFLKKFNVAVYKNFPDVQTIAEESTSFPKVSQPIELGGLGFGMKWMMGWMHDTLNYFKRDAYFRKFHHKDISFSLIYSFTENFMLPLSHDEVVHGKGALIQRMPGDEWQRFANLRLLYAYMFTHPGTKLLFMGGEFGQTTEWAHDVGLPWHLLDHPAHRGILNCVKNLNKLYQKERALYEYAFSQNGFEWIAYDDAENSILVYLRKSENKINNLLIIANFTPVIRHNYRVGVPDTTRRWTEIFNSDALEYGGSNVRNTNVISVESIGWHNRAQSISLHLPPLGLVVLKGNK